MILRKLKYILLPVFMLLSGMAWGQATSFTASAGKTTLVPGEQFRVTFSINAKGNGFAPPTFNGFTVLSGPNPSTQSSMQWINGNFTQTVTQTYTYILEAVKEGTYSIGPASITSGSSTYKTNPISITVVKGQNQASGSPSQGNSPSSSGQSQKSNVAASSDELFVRTYVSRNKVYKGEQITLTHKLYTSVPRLDLVDIKPPSYAGFWAEQIDGGRTITPHNEVLDGKTYRVAEISKTVLFPQKSGLIRIEPIQVECDVQIIKQRNASSFVEEMFYGPRVSYYANERQKIRSNPVSVTVEDLPLQGKPADFQGAVGDFKITAEINKNNLKANEAIDLKITISGTGNIKLIESLPIVFPPDFEVYDPRISDQVNVSGSGVSGKRAFEYVVIPLYEGKYELPSVNFSYFEPKSGKYYTVSTPSFNLTVGKGDSKGTPVVSSSQKDIKYINSDIRYIKTKPFALINSDDFFWGSPSYFSLFALPPFLFALFMLAYRKQMKNKANVAYVRNRRARKLSKRKLHKAKVFMDAGQYDNFFVEISQALWGYTADKFNIPLAELSIRSVKEIMQNRNVNEQKQEALLSVLNECEFARFAPGDSAQIMNKLYAGAIEVITALESEKL